MPRRPLVECGLAAHAELERRPSVVPVALLPMAQSEELLTVAEIAAELKMNQQTIRNWIESGYLPAIRIGRRVRVKRSDFEALLEASYTGGRHPPAGVWDGDVLAPVAPGEHDGHEASQPDAPDDPVEPGPDEAVDEPTG
jgi:excisionase family DNA binding protein